eukprot:1182765-Prorocentrum_minimum.AAC.11
MDKSVRGVDSSVGGVDSSVGGVDSSVGGVMDDELMTATPPELHEPSLVDVFNRGYQFYHDQLLSLEDHAATSQAVAAVTPIKKKE